ncbi:MAG: class I SAM-dependent methyltransferase [Myxococcota bacterium]|nr:class I SAM-dependent methyltransferase [Myxococcota bacterium]
MNILSQVFTALPRQGPGSTADTLNALSRVRDGFGPIENILDVGCGCGAQTMALLRNTTAQVTAVDLSASLLARLRTSAQAEGVNDRLTPVECSMKDMPLAPNSFDLIWSEGAVYIMGFEAALESFRTLLRPGGRVAISEMAWLVDPPPTAAAQWWEKEGASVVHDREKRRCLERQGYRILDTFLLSDTGWWDNYLTPMAERIAELRRGQSDPDAIAVLDRIDGEIAIHREYLGTYGYVFYIAELS